VSLLKAKKSLNVLMILISHSEREGKSEDLIGMDSMDIVEAE